MPTMKIFLIALLTVCIVSCKKNDSTTCEITMTQIAGSYHLTKFESVSYNTNATKDKTSTLTNCEISGIYHFNTDSTATYWVTNCSRVESGTWSLSGSFLNTSFTSSDVNRINNTLIISWNCTNLVLITTFPSVDSNY